MDAVRIEGGRKLAALARELRRIGTDRTIVNEMAKNIRRMAPLLRKAFKASAVSTLPRRGGLGAWVARSTMRISISRSARTAGIRIIIGRNSAGSRSDIKRIDAGGTRHPLFGNRAHWYPQIVRAGFASKVVAGPAADQFVTAGLDAIDTAFRQVFRGI